MASPNLTTECTAFPAFPVKRKARYSAEAIYFEDDVSVSYEDDTTKHREFTLVYENQSDSEQASFEAFFDARHGRRDTFYVNFARTSETDIKVRFDQDEVEFTTDNCKTWNWTVKLRKVT